MAGHADCWTEKSVRKFLASMSGGDVTIQQHPRGGYIVTDKYRPSVTYYGVTPKIAAREAGFICMGKH